MISSEVCLNIAVDHRIQRLFTKVALPVGTALPQPDERQAFSEVTSYIERNVRKLARDEKNVTTRLAGPYGVTNGITVLLQQPAEYHDFEFGTATTIRRCLSLHELHNIFQTVSLRSVGICDLNVLDTLAYVRPSDVEGLGRSVRRDIQGKILQVIQALSPKVVMCASRLPDRDGPLGCFKSLGVGKTMLQRCSDETATPQTIQVNAFHPSLALNRYPFEPETRQLLLLEAVHTCRQYDGTWEEQEWMSELRTRCKTLYATRFSNVESYIQETVRITNICREDEFQNSGMAKQRKEHFEDLVSLIERATKSISDTNDDAFSKDQDASDLEELYQNVLASQVSNCYNQI